MIQNLLLVVMFFVDILKIEIVDKIMFYYIIVGVFRSE